MPNHQALISLARARGIMVLADPKGTDFSIYRGASLITPNLHEFETIVGRCADEAELVHKGAALMNELALGALVIYRGGSWHDAAASSRLRCTCPPIP